MFMLKSTHDAAIKKAKIASEKQLSELARMDQRALDTERSITASLRAEVEQLRDPAEKWNAKLARESKARRDKTAAKRTAK